MRNLGEISDAGIPPRGSRLKKVPTSARSERSRDSRGIGQIENRVTSMTDRDYKDPDGRIVLFATFELLIVAESTSYYLVTAAWVLIGLLVSTLGARQRAQ